MLEARLNEAALFKKILESVKELVSDANFECNEEGINLQAMDNSHVALVSVFLNAKGFKRYRCDRPMPLGVNIGSLTKVLKCAKDDDVCIIKAADDADVLSLTYEAKNADRIAEYEMKLMDIDSESLGIPDTAYDAEVSMPAGEFQRIVRDLGQLGESVRIEVSKEGVRFISDGEAANGNILLRPTTEVKNGSSSKEAAGSDEEPEEEDEAHESEDDEEGSPKKKIKKEKVKEEKVKKEEDVEMNEDGEEQEENDEAEYKEEADADEEEEETSSKKRKKAPVKNGKPSKKAKKSDDDEETPRGVTIKLSQHVSLTFSLKYLVNFSKSTSLSKFVKLSLSSDVPLLVAYEFEEDSHIRYYLAPKIGED